MGKGSKPRPVDIKKYRNNHDEINWISRSTIDTQVAQMADLDENPSELKLIKTPKGKAKRYIYK